MSTPTWGLDPKARRITVYYEGESTIREGMPLCYNYDTTDNWMGVSSIDFTSTASSITESGTTAEGSQNEGKFIRVEDPSTTNLAWLAGVVAGADHDGETGPKALDIYIANGAVVPVRCNIDTTASGRSILAIDDAATSLTALGASSNYTSRAVAIAVEDVVGTAGTPVLCLAKLDPNMFICQDLSTGSSLIIAPSGTAYSALNRINVTTAATSGEMCAFEVKMAATGGINSPYGLAGYFKSTVSATMSDHACSVGVIMSITAGTSTEYITGLKVKMHSGASAVMTSVANLSVLNLESHIATTGPTPFSWIYFEGNGAVDPTYFMYIKSKGELGDWAEASRITTSAAGDRIIPISFGGSVYHLVAYADDGK